MENWEKMENPAQDQIKEAKALYRELKRSVRVPQKLISIPAISSVIRQSYVGVCHDKAHLKTRRKEIGKQSLHLNMKLKDILPNSEILLHEYTHRYINILDAYKMGFHMAFSDTLDVSDPSAIPSSVPPSQPCPI